MAIIFDIKGNKHQPYVKGDLSKYDHFFTEGAFLSEPSNTYAKAGDPNASGTSALKKLSIKDPIRALAGLFWAQTNNPAPELGANPSPAARWAPGSVIKPDLIKFSSKWMAGQGQKNVGAGQGIINLMRDYASEVKNNSSHKFANFNKSSDEYEIFIFGIYSTLQKHITIKKVGETSFKSPNTIMGYSLEPDNFYQTSAADSKIGLVEDYELYISYASVIDIAEINGVIFLWNAMMKAVFANWTNYELQDFLYTFWLHATNPELYPLDNKDALQKIGSKSFGKEYDSFPKVYISNKATHGGINYRYVREDSFPDKSFLVYQRHTSKRYADGTYAPVPHSGLKPDADGKDAEYYVRVPKTYTSDSKNKYYGFAYYPAQSTPLTSWFQNQFTRGLGTTEMREYGFGAHKLIVDAPSEFVYTNGAEYGAVLGTSSKLTIPAKETWWRISSDHSEKTVVITYLPDAPWILEEEDEFDRVRSYEDTSFRITQTPTAFLPVKQEKGAGKTYNTSKVDRYIQFSSRYNNRDADCENLSIGQNERSLPFFYMSSNGTSPVFSKENIPGVNYFGCKSNTNNDVPQAKRALVYPQMLLEHRNALIEELVCEDVPDCVPYAVNIFMPLRTTHGKIFLSPEQKSIALHAKDTGWNYERLASLYCMSNMAVSEVRQDCAGTNFGYYNEKHDYERYMRVGREYSNTKQAGVATEEIRSIEFDPRMGNTGAPDYKNPWEVWNTTYKSKKVLGETQADCAGGTAGHVLSSFAKYSSAKELANDISSDINKIQGVLKTNFVKGVEEDLLNHARSYEQILKGELAKYFVAGYKISKYRIITKPGNYTQELVQTFYIPTTIDDLTPALVFLDTQVKFNKMYRYSVEAVIAVIGTKYVFDTKRKPYVSQRITMDSQNTKGKISENGPRISYRDPSSTQGPGTLAPDLVAKPPANTLAALKFSIRSQPSVKLLSVPLTAGSNELLGNSTYGIFLAQDPQPIMTPTPYRFVNDKMMFMFEKTQGVSPTPHYPFDSGAGAWAPPKHMKSTWKQKITKIGSKVGDKHGTLAATTEQEETIAYELYRATAKPKALSDMIGTPAAPTKPHALISSRAFPVLPEPIDKSGDKIYDSWGDMFIDDLVPNTVYYYTVRATNKNSNAKPWAWPDPYAFKIEIIDDGSTLFPSIETIPLNIEKKLKDNITFKKKIKIAPAFLQAAPNKEKKDLGFAEESVFNRAFRNDIDLPAFKFRITSTKTGRKVDLNIIFTSEVKTSGPLPVDSELLLSWKK